MSAAFSPGTQPPLLVGRERELAVLRQHLDAAIAGHGSLVLVGGEAGIGKTALAEAICREAIADGALVLVGRSFDLSDSAAYGPWLYLFERYQPDPNLPPPPTAFTTPGQVGEVTSQAALHRQVLAFLKDLTAKRSVVLLLDDAQWFDPASLDLLRFLVQSVSTLRLLVIVTYRAEDLRDDQPLYRLLPLLVREANAERLDLRPLDNAAVRNLVDAQYRLPDGDTEHLVSYVQARTEGNALFVSELLRDLEEHRILRHEPDGWRLGDLGAMTVPPLLRAVIAERVARLGAESQRLLAVAAVIGQEVPLDVWAVAGDGDETMLVTVVERALDARLLVEMPDGQQVQFAHALVRETLYEGVPSIRRRKLHRVVGEVLAAGWSPNPDAVAYHFQRAQDERALPWLLKAGERAQAAYAWMTAAARFEAALALTERADTDAGERGWLLLRLSRLLRYVEVARARILADEAHTVAEAVGDRVLAAYSRFVRGHLACFAGEVVYGLPEIAAGADALAMLSDGERTHLATHAAAIDAPSRLPEGRGTVVLWRASVGWFREARELGERLVAETDAGVEEEVQAIRDGYHGLAEAYAALGMPDEAAAMYTIAHDTYLRAGHHSQTARVSHSEIEWVALPYRAEDIAWRQRVAERAEMERAQASGALPATVPTRFVRLPLLILEGHWDEAERLALAMNVKTLGMVRYRMTAFRHLATLARLRGDAERAWWAVREGLPAGSATEPGTVGYFDIVTAIQWVAVALALDAGDVPHTREWLDAHDRWLAWSGTVLWQSEGQALWAQYHRQSGAIDTAHEHAHRALTLATDPRQPLALLAAHRLLGELETEMRQFAAAAGHLDAALALADACAAPFERALTLLALAELQAATGKIIDATRSLEALRSICVPLGAKPALAKADALAERLVTMTAAPPVYPAGLSAREVEVLRLLASGKTNREIAATLFLSERTIDAHVRNIFTKTRTDNRAAATAFAYQHRLA